MMRRRFALILVPVALAALSCARSNPEQTAPEENRKTAASTEPASPPARINSARALEYVREMVALGPRPVASAAHKKLEDYLRTRLQHDSLEEDAFTAATPSGPVAMRNFIAKFPGTKDGVIVIAGHYDTKRQPSGFLGANDGGSSAALLLALADHLRAQKQRTGYSVWLVWFDGEEAWDRDITDRDGLYGSRHLAALWKQQGVTAKIRALLLADMIGDAQLDVLRDQRSTPWLLDLVQQAATNLGYRSHFFRFEGAMIDDHTAFAEAGVPVADLIDFDYGYQNAFWHTTDDTVDKLSPRSLEIVGNVMLQATWMLDQR